MAELSVLTLVYAPDLTLCMELADSLQRFLPEGTNAELIVPVEDVGKFEQLGAGQVRPECAALPPWFTIVPRISALTRRMSAFSPIPRIVAINRHRPVPPIRGWILQQILKLAAVAESTSDIVVVIDSDVELVRPITADTFRDGADVVLYRKVDAVTSELPHHVLWHQTARRVLGLPVGAPPYHDYISSFMAWDTGVVRSMLTHIEDLHHRPWQDVISGEVHFSEWTLYGVFVDEVLGRRNSQQLHRSSPLCLEWWGTTPLTPQAVPGFTAGLGADDVAVMISAKSGTSMEVRKQVRELIRSGRDAHHGVPGS
ncbi:DUF6492 family protein [Flexivirga alba]|uniref:DUF6492 family protein n=1 Tax=Flexivirga alba TaxID=702742 RepID=A0ABW2AG71_9MICO